MKFGKSHIEVWLKPSEMKILAEKYLDRVESYIKYCKENKFEGQTTMPFGCEEENLNVSVSFSWKPEFDENWECTNF